MIRRPKEFDIDITATNTSWKSCKH